MVKNRKALKEEHVPESWTRWRDRGRSPQAHAIAETTSPINVPVDIIAVQGLASTYEWTWTKQLDDGSSVMWLRDLLPQDLPDARIMTFEYDSKWFRDAAKVTLEDCGNRLLESIIWDRTHWKSQQVCPIMARRPLILIGHSYGGLVIKQALVTAAGVHERDPRYADCQAFITSVASVVFLGTPHNGSEAASVGLVRADFSKWLGQTPNIDILKPLVVESTLDALPKLERAFQKMLEYNDRLSKLKAAYFYEKEPAKIGPFRTTKLVVTQESACYGAARRNFEEVELEANHIELNKFGSRDEGNYTRLRTVLQRFHDEASQTVEGRLRKYEYGTGQLGGEVMEIRQWLSPENVHDEIYIRRKNDRLDGTCEWAEDADVLRSWLDMDSLPSMSSQRSSPAAEGQALWISGKAGSGKSVLAVYLYECIAKAHRGNNWSATDISRCSGSSETLDCQHYSVNSNKAALYVPISKTSTSASTIRTLVHQLLCFQPTRSELRRFVVKEKRGLEECTSEQGKHIFSVLLPSFPLVHIIIDGLDECERPKELVDLFKNISKQANVRIMFLARQDHELEHSALQDIPGLSMVDLINYNNSDILSFIEQKVSELARVNPFVSADAPSVVDQILQDARGMFQWVNLILYQLSQTKSKDDLFKMMKSFPTELSEAYAKTFHRLSKAPAFEPDILSLVLKLLTASYRPFSLDDLAMAVQLQKELDSRRRRHHRRPLDPNSLQECIDEAIKKIEELPDDYFAFLGPLIDIRPAAAANTDAPTNNTRPPRIVALCHHSLYQWIERTEQFTLRVAEHTEHAPWWKQIHFTRAQAHGALAGLTLTMMASQAMLAAHLQHLYHPARCPTPFLNYAGEFWFAHLRAVGAPAELALLTNAADGAFEVVEARVAHTTLADLARMALDNNMDMAAGVCAALSAALGAVSVHRVRGLPKVMALRGLERALLPASRGVAAVKRALPDMVGAAEEFQARNNATMKAGDKRQQQAEFAQASSMKSLGPKLDSETALYVLHMTESRAGGAAWSLLSRGPPLKRRIALLCQGARDIRRLAILMAVDPVRGWIYAQTGSTGISPLAALAAASEAIDTYLAASFLAPEMVKSYDMATQFTTQEGHPYYGLVSAASYELATQNYNGFSSAFYRENIMEHYRISRWEWNTIRFLLAAMGMSSTPPDHRMHLTLRMWVATHNVYSAENEDKDKYAAAVDVVGRVPFQTFSARAITVKQSLGLLTSAAAAFVFKYMTHLYPPLEDILLSMYGQFLVITGTLKPTVGYLFTNWTDFFVAFAFYLLRCRYFPWLFGNVRTSPRADLKGIINDPEGYVPEASSPYGYGYIAAILFYVQYLFIMILTINDGAKMVFDSKTGKLLPQSLQRRTSFKLGWTAENTPPLLRKLERAVETYGFHWFSSFRRIILLEMVALTLSYWIFDLIRSSAHAVTSALWSWKGALAYALQLVGYTYGRTAGFVNAGKLYLRIAFWSYLLVKYRETSAAGYAFRWVVRPAGAYVLGLCRGFFLWVAALLAELEGLVVRAVRQVPPRTLIFSTATAIPVLGVAIWYIFSDPLALGPAAESCAKAGEVAKELTGIENAKGLLRWNGKGNPDRDLEGVDVAFTGGLKDLEKEI